MWGLLNGYIYGRMKLRKKLLNKQLPNAVHIIDVLKEENEELKAKLNEIHKLT